MQSGIYEICNTVNGKRYIGSASNFAKRWSIHKSYLNQGKHHSQYLQNAWNKYGGEAFAFNRLLICSKHNIKFYEQICLDGLAREYNVCDDAAGFVIGNSAALGYRHTPEAIAKISAAGKNKRPPRSAEHRAKLAVARKLSSGNTGHRHSPESKAKMSASHKGRQHTDEWKAAISARMKGNKFAAGRTYVMSAETRAKISATKKASSAAKAA